MAETDRTMSTRLESLWERTSSGSRPFLDRVLRSLSGVVGPRATRAATAAEAIALSHKLLSERGERSGARLAADVVDAFRSLIGSEVAPFFDRLAREFSVDPVAIEAAARDYTVAPSPAALARLQQAVEPPRQELFRRLNVAPGGIGLLLDMRRQLLQTLPAHPEWAAIDADLVHLLRSWFNRGFLELRRLDWRTSALVLERLIHYEAVHQIQGWDDLRRRLDVDRRCYAFFHPALPDEPLIFIEIALTRGMPGAIQPLLDPAAPIADVSTTNCALFYSITNCQDGLRGISFGSFLIKRVVDDLRGSLPGLRTFATLSPIPGFVDWLRQTESPAPSPGATPTSAPWPVSAALRQLIEGLDDASAHGVNGETGGSGARHPATLELANSHETQDRDAGGDRARGPRGGDAGGQQTSEWPPLSEVQDEASRLCAYYLLHAKRGDAPLDSVARFHLANGARLERLNWKGDVSPIGMRRSLGMTVNYVYALGELDRNHDAYADRYDVVASRELQRLGEPPAPPRARGRSGRRK